MGTSFYKSSWVRHLEYLVWCIRHTAIRINRPSDLDQATLTYLVLCFLLSAYWGGRKLFFIKLKWANRWRWSWIWSFGVLWVVNFRFIIIIVWLCRTMARKKFKVSLIGKIPIERGSKLLNWCCQEPPQPKLWIHRRFTWASLYWINITKIIKSNR